MYRIINILSIIPIWTLILLFPIFVLSFDLNPDYSAGIIVLLVVSLIISVITSVITIAIVIAERDEVNNVSCTIPSYGRSPYGNFFYKIRKKKNVLTAHLYKWKVFWIGYAKVNVTVETGKEKEAFDELYKKMIKKKEKFTSKEKIHKNQLKMIKEFKNHIQDKETLFQSDSYIKELEKIC